MSLFIRLVCNGDMKVDINGARLPAWPDRQSALIFLRDSVPSGRRNCIVRARFIENQSKCRWCHSIAKTATFTSWWLIKTKHCLLHSQGKRASAYYDNHTELHVSEKQKQSTNICMLMQKKHLTSHVKGRPCLFPNMSKLCICWGLF